MNDKVEKYKNSLLQHGKMNDRVYLMKLAPEDCPAVVNYLDELANTNSYAKVVAKVPFGLREAFYQQGYKQEAYIKGFFKGVEDCCFLSKYFDKKREIILNVEKMLAVKNLCAIRSNFAGLPVLTDKYSVKQLDNSHIADLAALYSQVFPHYPFPIQDAGYLQQTMQANVDYFGVFYNSILVAAAASEMDINNQNTEMTDFATLPKFRTMGISRILLTEMEKTAKDKGIVTAYTIARATSYGINIIFAKGQYTFAGVLANNTNISTGIESMNVWAKAL